MMRSFVAVAALALPLGLFGQEFRATINGSVTDATGAVVPGAKITITETHTGTKAQSVSESSGQYTVPFLLPGDYDVSVQAQGFKESIRKGIHAGSGDHVGIDFVIELGNTTQTVEVTASAPLLNSESASIGQAITSKEVENLPLNGGTPLVLASLSIGVLATGQPALIHPFDSGAAAGWSIAGSPSQTNEILIDGSPDATWDGRLAYSPPRDAVQEVRVKAFDADAAFGHTGGGTLNQVLKTGTNQVHGSAWEYNEPNTLTANNFFNNKTIPALKTPVTHYNQYGVTVGAPIVIPKLFDGRNKLFAFFAWEDVKDSQPNTTFLSVPTAAERTGNFSELLALGSQYQLYNPYAATLSGTTITRQPYSNNTIPASQLNPIAQAYLKYIPLPNSQGQAGGLNNFASPAGTPDDYSNELGRVDYNISDHDRMFFELRHTNYLQSKNNYFGNESTGSLLTRENKGFSIDDVHTFNATNIFDLRFNFTRMDEAHPAPSLGFDPTSIGFPSYIAANSQLLQLPNVGFATNSGLTTLGSNGANLLPSQSVQIFGTHVTIKGNHTLKAGFDLRQYVLNTISFGNSAGSYSFSANSWVKATSAASSTVVPGQDFAEFLIGLPTSGTFDINTSAAYYEHYMAFFVQDDWRVKRNFSVNLGVRFDYDAPYHEKYGRTVNGFDGTTQNPLAPAAIAAYNANPISQIPVGSFNVLGGLTYPSNGAMYQQNSHLFSPRVGVAWTPDLLKGKTVIRAGFAMFVQPINISQLAITGAYSTNPVLVQEGFSQATPYTASNDSFLTPATTLSNPFPTGIKQPAGSSAGLGTYAGQTVQIFNPQVKDPYSLRWNFGFEQALTKDTKLEVVYMGNHGLNLPIFVTQLNSVPRQYLSTLPTRDQTLITALSATVPNPFAKLNTAQNGSTATVAQLLSRFPQFPTGTGSFSAGVIELNNTAGSSYFESFNVRIQHRLASGLTLVGNFIHSRLEERSEFLNDTDTTPEKRISPFDHPNRLVFALVYDLPFGRGRRFLSSQSRWVDALVGGWGINTIYTYQTGAPLTWVNGSTTNPGDYIYYGGDVALNNRNVDGPAFNTSVFETNSAKALQYHIRTFSSTFSNIRQDGINEWSPSLSKQFSIRENMGFQLRAEAYNVLNHPTFAAPNTTATNAAFGVITAQANKPRVIQLVGRFVF